MKDEVQRLKRLGVPAAEVKRRSAKAKATRNKTAVYQHAKTGGKRPVPPPQGRLRVVQGPLAR